MRGGRPVHVAGVGIHPFGRFDGKDVTRLGQHAVREALAEAGLARGGFGAAFCGTVYTGVAAGHKVLSGLGLSGVPIVNVEAGCASGGAALSLGAAAVASGEHDRVLVFGMEKMPRGIIRSLGLRKAIYSTTATHGHFGRAPGEGGPGTFTWERTDKAAALKADAKKHAKA